MVWHYPYFTQAEMQCPCGCGKLPEDKFMQVLVTVREEAGFPFPISSGARCYAYNLAVGGGKNSAHVLGLAADILLFGMEALSALEAGVKHGMTGIGVSQKGEFAKRFIHLDIAPASEEQPRPWIWSY